MLKNVLIETHLITKFDLYSYSNKFVVNYFFDWKKEFSGP